MDYIVRDACIVNGVPRKRGDELTGDDAAAVEKSPLLRARCIPHAYNQKNPAPAAKPAPAPAASAPVKE